jgi:hypothetical protein
LVYDTEKNCPSWAEKTLCIGKFQCRRPGRNGSGATVHWSSPSTR